MTPAEKLLALLGGSAVGVFVVILAVSLFLPQAEATTVLSKYSGLNTSPLQPLVFIQDSYGNVHVSSSDTYVWRVLRCTAPASGYDAYLSTGILQSHGLRVSANTSPYKSPVWYTQDIDFSTGYDRVVIDPQVLRGSELMAYVEIKQAVSPFNGEGRPVDNKSPNMLSVYYLPAKDTEPTAQYRDYSSIITPNNAGELYVLDLDEELLKTRGFLYLEFNYTNGYKRVPEYRTGDSGYTAIRSGYPVPDTNSRFFLYGNVPGGQTGYQTVEHSPSTYLQGSQDPVAVGGKLGDVVFGYNLPANPKLSLISRVELDIFRTTALGPIEPFSIYRPAVYLSLIHISEPTRLRRSRMPSSA